MHYLMRGILCLALSAGSAAAQTPRMPFSGVYLGMQAGQVAAEIDHQVEVPPDAFVDGIGLNDRSWLAGAQLGALYRWNNLVVGGEIAYVRAGARKEMESDLGEGRMRSMAIEHLLMPSLRLGLAMGPVLPYVKGGVGLAQLELGLSSPTLPRATTKEWELGTLYGVGVEWQMSSAFSVAVEWSRLDLSDSHDRATTGITPNSGRQILQTDIAGEIDLVTARFNVRLP